MHLTRFRILVLMLSLILVGLGGYYLYLRYWPVTMSVESNIEGMRVEEHLGEYSDVFKNGNLLSEDARSRYTPRLTLTDQSQAKNLHYFENGVDIYPVSYSYTINEKNKTIDVVVGVNTTLDNPNLSVYVSHAFLQAYEFAQWDLGQPIESQSWPKLITSTVLAGGNPPIVIRTQ